MKFRWPQGFRGTGRGVPEDIYIPLVDSLYKDGRTLFAGTIFAVGAILLTYLRTAEPGLLACAAAFSLVAGVRAAIIRAYARAQPGIVTEEAARRWEHRYVAGAAMSVALLGVWCFITLAATADPFAPLVSFSMTLAYVIGIFGRNFGSPRFVIVQILCAAVPIMSGLLLYGDVYHWIFAFLLLPFFMSVKFISERLRKNLLDAVIATRDMSQLAMRFNTALDNMPHGLCMFGTDGRMAVANPRAIEFLGLPTDFCLKGMNAHSLIRACVRAGTIGMRDARRLVRSAGLSASGLPTYERVDTHDHRSLEMTFQPMDGRAMVVVIQDITERERAEAQINHLARFDALTGLANRQTLRDCITQTTDHGESGDTFAVHFVDLDHFKQVNDTLGHSRGDVLLRNVAERLVRLVRSSDVVARFGGDEFVVLQRPIADGNQASTLAKRIVTELGRPYSIDGHQVVVGASVGIVLARNGADPDHLLSNADLALYSSKADSRGTWRFFQPEMEIKAQRRRGLELDLHEALATDAFEVHFQPIIDLKRNRVTACEALLRWPHPTRGLVPAAEFISMAEDIGLIVELGRRMLLKACLECLEWPDGIAVAVNLSPLQFARDEIPALMRDALATTGLAPHRVHVEITESALLQNTRSVRAALQELRTIGVKIALDDFGTGYSSLSYLHSFPLDKVKLDRSFLQGTNTSKTKRTLLHGVARLSAELGLSVVVEGIETQRQLDMILGDGNIREAQGYYFGRPVPGRQIRERLRRPAEHLTRVA